MSARDAARIVLFAVLYTAAAILGLRMGAVSNFATLVWAPTGLSIAALLVFGRRHWPAIVIGALAANLWNGASLPVAAAIAVGNTLEAILAATIASAAGLRVSLDRVRDAAVFVLAVFAGATVSASIGVASLIGAGAAAEGIGATWGAWWVGDVIGGLVVAPLLLVWGSPRTHRAKRLAETFALAATTAGVGAFLFFLPVVAEHASPFRDAYMVFPVIAWAALRFELRGATAVGFVLSVVAITGTALGKGPFATDSLNEGLLRLQVFMGIAVMTALCLAAATAERRSAQREARAATKVLEEFLSVASHELRSPLSAVVLELAGLERLTRSGSDSGSTVAAKIERTVRNTKRLSTLVERLLDLSRVTAGRMKLDPESMDLAVVVREAVDRLAPEAERAGCTMELRMQPGVGGQWDPFRIDQVATNLLSNAVKYGAGGRVEVDVDAMDGRARIVVRDHGIGIPPSERESVFARFARASTAKGYAGLGLGLYITRQIVEAHGGSIRAEAPTDGGTAFVVELPLGY